MTARKTSGRELDPTRFEDGGEIGRGGMGTVRRIWDRRLCRPVALKALHEEEDWLTKPFLEEARIMGMLDHPNVPAVYDLQSDAPGGPSLLMKLVEGRTLADLLHDTGDPPAGTRLERLLGVVLRVCDAVAFAHSRGVVHRDLHPRNVMVGSHGQVYLMDWGLAVRQDAERPKPGVATGVIGSGTPAYMSPEQAWGRDDEIDQRTDVFGIGTLLYEMLTLRPPFTGAALEDVVGAARRGDVVPPDAVAPGIRPPARLCEITMRALSVDRGARHPSVDVLRDELEAFLRSGGWFAAQRFAAGAFMLREGEVGDCAYLITEGTCQVIRGGGATPDVLRTVGPGGIVGEIGLLTGEPRVASVRALTDVTALVVTRESLESELGRAGWMRAFVQAAVERFAELDAVQRTRSRHP